jgi:hypothetical protein
MSNFASAILSYYKQLTAPSNLPAGVEVMNPYSTEETFQYAKLFYEKYYSDHQNRFICFGINPGRFGAGVTGVPFTDPLLLESACGIPNDLEKKPELSSRFIHEMINEYGGPRSFFDKYYISAVSPLGYLKEGINLNYYDIKGFKALFEKYVVDQISIQLDFGLHTHVAYSIGKGQNVKYLHHINEKHGFFKKIIPLSHPRWVMQYRLKRKDEFIQEYLDTFHHHEQLTKE